ncbi:MAG TPA: LCP family protein, partial [Allocoleopsis sp.]
PQDMKYQDDSQHLYINLKQGDQHLNGNQAMQFLRFRYDAYGDIGRVQRQQMLMRAFIEQALKPATLTRLPQVLSVIQSNLDTNLSVEELIALVGFAAQTDRPNVQMLMLPGYFGSEAEYGASYWLPNLPSIESLVSQYFSRDGVIDVSATVPNTLKLAVQDSTGETYTVQSLLNHLGNIGYSNIYVDQPWNESLAVTKIIAQQGDAQNAERIRQALGFGEVLVESTGSLDSDITIRLGQDAISALQPSSPPASPSPGIAPANQIPAIESSTPSSDPAVAPAVMESSSEAPVEPAPEIQVEPPAESSDTTDAIEPAAKATPPLELNPPVAASPEVVAPVAISPTPLHSKLPVVAASPAINPPVASPVAAPSIVLQKTEPASSTAQPTLSP